MDATTALKIGLIGCGRIAQLVHLRVLTALPGARLVAVAEPDAQRRAAAGRQAPGAVACADYRELLALPELDAAVICLPPALHAEAAIAALARGKHVYLEKPLATDLDEGERVLAAWRRAGTVGQIGFNYRFTPLVGAARDHLRAGRLGTLAGARTTFTSAPRALPDWKRSRASGGGVLLDLASHHLDLVRFLFEREVIEVAAQLRSQRGEDDGAMVLLRLADGLPVQSFFSTGAVEEDRIEIYGQAGKLTIDRHLSGAAEVTAATLERARLTRLRHALRSLAGTTYLRDKVRGPAYLASYRAALGHFVARARAGQPATPDLLDGYRSLALVAAAEEAARGGRTVAPREPG